MSLMKSAIYIRVSTEDQVKEGYSLTVQREHLETFAKREGLEIFKIKRKGVKRKGVRPQHLTKR